MTDKRRRVHPVIGWLIIPTVLVALFLILTTDSDPAEARGRVCHGNLHKIGVGIELYMADHDGLMPTNLDGLYPEHVEALATFDCPAANSSASYPGLEQSGSYRYVGAINWAAPGDTIVVYDKRGNHPDGRCALFMDHHVEFIYEADLADRLRESLADVKAAGWDQYSEEQKKRIEAFYTPD